MRNALESTFVLACVALYGSSCEVPTGLADGILVSCAGSGVWRQSVHRHQHTGELPAEAEARLLHVKTEMVDGRLHPPVLLQLAFGCSVPAAPPILPT